MPSKANGQCRAHRTPARLTRPSPPISKTNSPDQWWLYSDHATSAALRAGSSPDPGTKAGGAS